MNMFAGTIGHSRIQEVLSRFLEHKTLPHALLFVGPESVGKTHLAHFLFRELLGHQGDLFSHPDFLTLERLVDEKTEKKKTQISVAQVRELTSRLGMSSLSGGWQIVFIEEASTLSIGAANALLKTLEEPKGNVLFLLRAQHTEDLPPTIVSRCQVLRFHDVPRDEITERLVKTGFSPTDANEASAQALGRPGRAIRFLKESLYRSEQETNLTQATSFFSSGLADRMGQVMDLIPKSETQKNERLVSLLTQFELVSRDLLLRKIGLNELSLYSKVDSLDTLSKEMSLKELLQLLDRIAQVRASSNSNINSHLALEHIALAI